MSTPELSSIIGDRDLPGLPIGMPGGNVAPELVVAMRRRDGELEPEVWPDLLSAIWDRLANAPALAALGQRVYLSEGPTKPQYPYLVINELNGVPGITTDQADYWEDVFVQFTTLATDDTQAFELGRLAHALLSRRADNPKLAFADGQDIARYPGRRRGPYRMPNLAGGNAYLWAYMFEYRFMVSRRS